jgi:hypothetical protein
MWDLAVKDLRWKRSRMGCRAPDRGSQCNPSAVGVGE